MIEIIPNWHPIWVHFAIALLSTSAFLLLIFGWRSSQTTGRTNALIVARWTLRLGVIAALGALVSGFLASSSVAHDDVSHANMMVHRNWALAATSIFAVIALFDLVKRNKTRFSVVTILLLVAGGITLTKTGLEGAENVYQYGLGVQSLPDISKHEHSGGIETSKHDHAGAEQVAEAGGHDESINATKGDDHNHSHSDTPETLDAEISIEDSDHPAGLLAAKLSNAIATGDVDTLRSALAPDVLIFESGGVESSLAEYEGHHMPADMAFMKAMRRELISRQVFDLGDSATVVTRSRVHGVYKNKEIDLSSTETLVMRQLDGQWKVVHIHWSSS